MAIDLLAIDEANVCQLNFTILWIELWVPNGQSKVIVSLE
jgi:hypothetical protein